MIRDTMDISKEEDAALGVWEKGEFESAKFAFSVDRSELSDEAVSQLKKGVEDVNRWFGGDVFEVIENEKYVVLVIQHFYASPPVPVFIRYAMTRRKLKEEHPESFTG